MSGLYLFKPFTIDGNSYTFAYTYNASTGMLETYEYPSGYKLKYLYDSRGNQHEVRTADAANTLLWKANAENQRGQLTQATMGNGTITDFEWDTYGFPQRNKVSKGSTILQNLTFSFNSVTGNLNARSDAKRNILETFGYDNLLKDRLISWSASGGAAKTMTYEANGNILKKTDVSTSNTGYVYDTDKPNFVKKVINPTAAFLEQNQLQNITYTPFNKIESISQPGFGYNVKLDFTYGPDNERRKTFLYKASSPVTPYETRYYFDDFEVRELYHKSLTEKIHYLYGPDGMFGICMFDGGYQEIYFIHKDYLGSLTAISDATGNLVESLSYDPWGRRRNADDWNDYNVTSTMFDRGFTGHEHLPQFGLINMNGRVYDPFLARFLSPDPFVQAPDYSQNFNRYSYCVNNPLKYTDPSGEFIFTALLPGVGVFLDAMCWGAVIGGGIGGIRGAMTEGMTFWDGAWRGAVVGAVGGLMAPIGGAGMTFATNLGLGTAQGAITGGLDAALWGNDIGKGMLWGAAAGAVFTTLTSENFSNWTKGKGFYNNENVFNNFKAGKYGIPEGSTWQQEALNHFGFEGTYDPNAPLFQKHGAHPGITDPRTGDIFYHDYPFEGNFDRLALTADHEMIHSRNVLSGKYNGVKIDFEVAGKEEWSTYLHNYRNQGLYRNHGTPLVSRMNHYGIQGGIYEMVISPTGSYSTQFNSQWWHFLYRIPRRW